MSTNRYSLEEIVIINTLGYTKREKEAVDLAMTPMIEAGVKFAVLCFEDGFMLQMHNLNEQEQQAVIDETIAEYNFCLKNA